MVRSKRLVEKFGSEAKGTLLSAADFEKIAENLVGEITRITGEVVAAKMDDIVSATITRLDVPAIAAGIVQSVLDEFNAEYVEEPNPESEDGEDTEDTE